MISRYLVVYNMNKYCQNKQKGNNTPGSGEMLRGRAWYRDGAIAVIVV